MFTYDCNFGVRFPEGGHILLLCDIIEPFDYESLLSVSKVRPSKYVWHCGCGHRDIQSGTRVQWGKAERRDWKRSRQSSRPSKQVPYVKKTKQRAQDEILTQDFRSSVYYWQTSASAPPDRRELREGENTAVTNVQKDGNNPPSPQTLTHTPTSLIRFSLFSSQRSPKNGGLWELARSETGFWTWL